MEIGWSTLSKDPQGDQGQQEAVGVCVDGSRPS